MDTTKLMTFGKYRNRHSIEWIFVNDRSYFNYLYYQGDHRTGYMRAIGQRMQDLIRPEQLKSINYSSDDELPWV
jgi:hypothetical protein